MTSKGLGLVVLAAALASARPGAPEEPHPLQPPDTSSPRATLTTFLGSFDRAWSLYSRHDPAWRPAFVEAFRCLDTSQVPPSVRDAVGAEATLLLKETLDRLPLPPEDEIPGAAEVEAQQLARWTLPHTEVSIERVASGERQGEFLFTAATVARIREFYEKVQHLPYQPGRDGAHYDELRFGGLSPELARIAARLPPWARREVAGALAWQWAVFSVGLILAVLALALAVRLGRRLRLPFLPPVALIAAALGARWAAFLMLRLAGLPYIVLRLAFTAIAHVGVAWLLAVLIGQLGRLFLHFLQGPEQLRNAQLVRVTFRVLTVLAVGGYLFVAAQTLGLPVPALIAGLGVGGLAVALATQGTLENLIAGFILHADRPVRVGDVVRIDERIGVVQEIGLRSARIRTIDRSMLAIPNAELVRRELENLTLQDRIPMRTTMKLAPDTSSAALGSMLASIDAMLREHPRLVKDKGGARLVGFGEFSIEVQVKAFAATTDWAEFLATRQDVFLKVLRLVEEAGVKLALPW